MGFQESQEDWYGRPSFCHLIKGGIEGEKESDPFGKARGRTCDRLKKKGERERYGNYSDSASGSREKRELADEEHERWDRSDRRTRLVFEARHGGSYVQSQRGREDSLRCFEKITEDQAPFRKRRV